MPQASPSAMKDGLHAQRGVGDVGGAARDGDEQSIDALGNHRAIGDLEGIVGHEKVSGPQLRVGGVVLRTACESNSNSTMEIPSGCLAGSRFRTSASRRSGSGCIPPRSDDTDARNLMRPVTVVGELILRKAHWMASFPDRRGHRFVVLQQQTRPRCGSNTVQRSGGAPRVPLPASPSSLRRDRATRRNTGLGMRVVAVHLELPVRHFVRAGSPD